jgi:hypothetical protein
MSTAIKILVVGTLLVGCSSTDGSNSSGAGGSGTGGSNAAGSGGASGGASGSQGSGGAVSSTGGGGSAGEGTTGGASGGPEDDGGPPGSDDGGSGTTVPDSGTSMGNGTPPYGCTGCTRLFDGTTLTGWDTAPGAWVVKEGGVLASTGKAADIYTHEDLGDYRVFFQVKHLPPMGGGDHMPCVVLFGKRPADPTAAARALGGAQFQPPNGFSWDYGIGGKFTSPKPRPTMDQHVWNQCEMADCSMSIGRSGSSAVPRRTATSRRSDGDRDSPMRVLPGHEGRRKRDAGTSSASHRRGALGLPTTP